MCVDGKYMSVPNAREPRAAKKSVGGTPRVY